MSEYRVNLEVYNGPLDLLLYLIRRDELDIYDIPISLVTEQYLKYVEVLQQVDPNLAGEFLVLAASLMEIKTRMLLPAEAQEEGAPQTGSALDPRRELVRQLLQYKAFKDAAGDLSDAAHQQAMKFPRRPVIPNQEQGEFDLEDVQVWDLLDAFSKLMASIGKAGRLHEVIYDDTPVELHAADIVDRLAREGPLTFAQVFEGRTNRGEIVGLFLALLELVRQKKVLAVQDSNFGDIRIAVNPDAPAEETPDHVASFAEAPVGCDEQSLPSRVTPVTNDEEEGGTREQRSSQPTDSSEPTDAPKPELGRYISESSESLEDDFEKNPDEQDFNDQEHNDDTTGEDQGAGA